MIGELLSKLYKKIWQATGDKPWTYRIRDDQKNNPLLYLLLFLAIGVFIGKFCKKYWWQVLIIIVAGVVIGHIFW